MLTRIKNILGREGLVVTAITGIIETIISTIFAIIIGSSKPGLYPSPGLDPVPVLKPKSEPEADPKPQPVPELNKIKEFIKKFF